MDLKFASNLSHSTGCTLAECEAFRQSLIFNLTAHKGPITRAMKKEMMQTDNHCDQNDLVESQFLNSIAENGNVENQKLPFHVQKLRNPNLKSDTNPKESSNTEKSVDAGDPESNMPTIGPKEQEKIVANNPNCDICNKLIKPLDFVKAVDKIYHKWCFKCL